MCKSQAATDQPLTTPGTSLPSGGTAGAGAVNGDPLSSAIQAESAANPKTASVNAPTKFGHLLSFIAPLAAGAAIGGLAGRGHPGGGFGAANEVFTKRRQMDIEQQMRQAQIANYANEAKLRQATIELDAARTSHVLNQPEYANSRIATVEDPDNPGQSVQKARNPQTGAWETIGKAADKPEKFTALPTDSGFQKFNTGTGEVDPIMARGTAGPAESTTSVPVGPNPVGPGQFGGATASPSAIRSRGVPTGVPGVPLMPVSTRKDNQPHAEKVTSRSGNGDEVDSLIDNNFGSDTFGQVLKKGVAFRADRPDKRAEKSDELTPAQAARLTKGYQDKLRSEIDVSEKQRAKDLDEAGFPNGVVKNDKQAAIVKGIEDANADRKQRLHESIASDAQANGIDIGQVPDYHAPLVNGRSPVPKTAPIPDTSIAVRPSAAQAWAKKKGISLAEAQKQIQAKGYKFASQ